MFCVHLPYVAIVFAGRARYPTSASTTQCKNARHVCKCGAPDIGSRRQVHANLVAFAVQTSNSNYSFVNVCGRAPPSSSQPTRVHSKKIGEIYSARSFSANPSNKQQIILANKLLF